MLASGAGASARKSLGLAVATGMLTSTCLAVLFVPAFYVVLQQWAERSVPGNRPFIDADQPGPGLLIFEARQIGKKSRSDNIACF